MFFVISVVRMFEEKVAQFLEKHKTQIKSLFEPQKAYSNAVLSFLTALLRNCLLCWDCWNGDVTPTLDSALLCSSRAGSDLGRESGLVQEL